MLTEEQQLIQQTARNFAQAELAPHAGQWDRESRFPADAVKRMGELGFLGMIAPGEWGGGGADQVSHALALEEIAAGDGSCSTIMSVHNSVGCMPIAAFGDDEQKRRFLRPLATGQKLGAFALTEPHAGSDASAIRTRAEFDGQCYTLNGTKQFITSAKNADTVIAFAVTDVGAGKRGISAFIVPTDAPGYRVSRLESKLGQRASDTAQLTFDNMRLTPAHRLGEEGQGYRIALSNLEGGRIGIAAQSVGMARAALAAALAYAKERKTFGELLIKHQAVAFRLADMSTQIEAAHLMTCNAAALKDRGEPCLKQASMAKLFASEMAEKVSSDALQIHGGYGYVNGYPVERIYRDVRVTQIYEGASDIQRMLIARALEEAD
ncbi:MAG: acyl-CoA dehydrogenase [Gammaproteobacteria bacterium]|nr:acyl-CoA dehydrogenase [Gammaproteobacteria bacterium]